MLRVPDADRAATDLTPSLSSSVVIALLWDVSEQVHLSLHDVADVKVPDAAGTVRFVTRGSLVLSTAPPPSGVPSSGDPPVSAAM